MSKGSIFVSKNEYDNAKCNKCGIHSIGGLIAYDIDEPLESQNVAWKHSKNHLSAFETIKNKEREIYWIPKNRCQSKSQQIDWVNQIAGKRWGDRYKFTAALKRACQDWGTW